MASSALRAFGVEGVLPVLEKGEHQLLEIAVVHFVFENGDVPEGEKALAVFVEGFEDEEVQGEGTGVVAAGFFLGAFTLRHHEAVVVEGELVAVVEQDRLFEEAAVGGFEEAVDGAVGRNRHCYAGTYLRIVVVREHVKSLRRSGGEGAWRGAQLFEKSKVGAALGRKLIETLWPSSGLTDRLAEVRITGTVTKRLLVSLTEPLTTTRSM